MQFEIEWPFFDASDSFSIFLMKRSQCTLFGHVQNAMCTSKQSAMSSQADQILTLAFWYCFENQPRLSYKYSMENTV